ncbi:hypothetical protein [Pelagibaculum spongiae]|uniref:HTH gntR-type domain-containing protein n=1 Tax=Pelagibaculum spongiae TaxID=2080658 RepID=A0A2V1GZ00_9GAMM|nr:hypothetical protein [Pelagibaculum spongiae]PVZ70597.1 hypothetical protein DC094_08440 [Pelagibaculum spongiae]
MYPLAYNIAKDFLERHIDDKPSIRFDQGPTEAEKFSCSERVYRRVITQLIDLKIVQKDGNEILVKDHDKLSRFIHSHEEK